MNTRSLNVQKRSVFLSILIGLAPLLGAYRSPIEIIDMSTFLFLGCYILLLLKGKCYFNNSSFNLIFLYILIITPISIMLQSFYPSSYSIPFNTVFLRYGKFVVLLGGYLILTKNQDFDTKLCIKVIRCVVYISFIFIIVQRAFYLTGRILNNPFIKYASSDLYNGYSMVSTLFRPSAIFLEPSHMALYCIAFLCYTLFSEGNKTKKRDTMITIISIICTGSGMGVLSVVALMIYWSICAKKLSLKRILIIIILVAVAFLLYQTEFMQAVLARVFTNNAAGGGNAFVGRIGKGYIIWSQLPLLYKLIGNGFGNIAPNLYFNGITYMLNTIGICGCFLFVILIIRTYKASQKWSRILLLLYCALLFGSQLFTASSLMFYFSLTQCFFPSRRNEEPKLNEKKFDTYTRSKYLISCGQYCK